MGRPTRGRLLGLALAACALACGGAGATTGAEGPFASAAGGALVAERGFPEPAPWLSFYGSAGEMGELERVAGTFRVINIDADPGIGNFTTDEIARLKAGGRNRVISYLNLGACESFRDYYRTAPDGLVPCGANRAAQLGAYDGYPDEVWMNPADADYQRLVLELVAPRLAAQGIDGFFLDNLELLEHETDTANGPCDAACVAGGLELVARLRAAYPTHLIVMQNATSDVTRLATVRGVPYPSLLDGVSHEEVYKPAPDPEAERQLMAWRDLGLAPGGRALWVATEDYVGDCDALDAAREAYTLSRAQAFSPYATDASEGQHVVCYWPF